MGLTPMDAEGKGGMRERDIEIEAINRTSEDRLKRTKALERVFRAAMDVSEMRATHPDDFGSFEVDVDVLDQLDTTLDTLQENTHE